MCVHLNVFKWVKLTKSTMGSFWSSCCFAGRRFGSGCSKDQLKACEDLYEASAHSRDLLVANLISALIAPITNLES